jgi:hypothetical protein
MQETQAPLQTLQDIKKIMERSSRFISLSGWSGISAGACALLGAFVAYWRIGEYVRVSPTLGPNTAVEYASQLSLLDDLIWIAAIVFIAACTSAFFFTYVRSRKNNTPVWDPVSRRLMWNMVIPLFIGGIALLRLLQLGYYEVLGPLSLIFYGLALLNASKYTSGELRYLAIAQLVLGCMNLWMRGAELYFWALGFGVLHIVYGIVMWWKYER